MNAIWLSILIPTRNRLALLKESVDSVMSQWEEGVEVVISDNNSNDGTKDYLRALHNKNISVLLRDGDGGFKANVNNLVENSCGKYFILLHDDDLLASGAIKIIKGVIASAAQSNSLIIGSYELLDETSSSVVRSKTQFPSAVLSSLSAIDFFSSRWLMRAPALYYNREFAANPFYTDEFGVARDSKVIFDYIMAGGVTVTAEIIGVYRQGCMAETVNTIHGENWGLASLKFVRYMKNVCRAIKVPDVVSRRLTFSIYGDWLMALFRFHLKRFNLIQSFEYLVAFLILKITGKPISWRFRLKLMTNNIKFLSKYLGVFGRRLSLRLYSKIKSPSLVSKSAQLIGLSGIEIGANTTLGQSVTIIVNNVPDKRGIVIGPHGYIGKNVYISVGDAIEIGSHSLIGAGVQILGAGHKMDPRMPIRSAQIDSYGSIFIGNNVWIGNGAILIGNLTIGDGSVIAAGAHVRNINIPRFALAAGNPARIVRQYNFNTNKWEKLINGCVESDESRGIPATWDLIACDKIFTEITPDKISFSEEGGYLY